MHVCKMFPVSSMMKNNIKLCASFCCWLMLFDAPLPMFLPNFACFEIHSSTVLNTHGKNNHPAAVSASSAACIAERLWTSGFFENFRSWNFGLLFPQRFLTLPILVCFCSSINVSYSLLPLQSCPCFWIRSIPPAPWFPPAGPLPPLPPLPARRPALATPVALQDLWGHAGKPNCTPASMLGRPGFSGFKIIRCVNIIISQHRPEKSVERYHPSIFRNLCQNDPKNPFSIQIFLGHADFTLLYDLTGWKKKSGIFYCTASFFLHG